jgi:GNAT superfamily N-acetyltransferase
LDNDAVELRGATSDDVDACLVVQRRSAVVGYAHIFAQDLYPFPDDVVRAEWVRRLASDALVVVASEGGELIGTVSARPPWVEALFVVPEAWGTGVAGRLLDRALDLIADSGAAAAELDVMAQNARARRFYERRGWTPDGRTAVSPFPPYPNLLGYRLELAR